MICYENRWGLVAAVDTDTKMFVLPGMEDSKDFPEAWDCSPDRMREELERRGVESVHVYVGKSGNWFDGKLPVPYCAFSFRHAALNTGGRPNASWKAVPVSRIGDATSLFTA
jgi:hypothetical protein